MTIITLKNAILPLGSIESAGGALERRDVFINNGVIDLTLDDSMVDETWKLEGEWLILPGLIHTMYLSPESGMGLEMISKAVRKGATTLMVDDVVRWRELMLQSDFPDLATVLQQSLSCKEKLQCMINPWSVVKKLVLDLLKEGSDLHLALGKVLHDFGCSHIKQGQDADLIFIKLNSAVDQEKLSDLIFPMLMLENEHQMIKAVMKKGNLLYSKYGCSLDSKSFVFEEPFYPQISQKIDSKFDSIQKAIKDIGNFL